MLYTICCDLCLLWKLNLAGIKMVNIKYKLLRHLYAAHWEKRALYLFAADALKIQHGRFLDLFKGLLFWSLFWQSFHVMTAPANSNIGIHNTERWYLTREQIINSPSFKTGHISTPKETSYRQHGALLIQEMGQKLKVWVPFTSEN